VGVFKGSISATKFYVRGSVPKRFAAPYLEKIESTKFVELNVDDEPTESVGWCVASSPLDTSLHHEQVYWGSYVLLGMRTDRWRIPRPLFKAQFDRAAAEWVERTGRQKMNKREKDELKFRIERKLRRKVLPNMRSVDVCWNMERGSLLLWSRSPRVKEDFRELFERTFSLELDEDSPFMTAKYLLEPEELETLSGLAPSVAVPEEE
jgi:hypothetical protein